MKKSLLTIAFILIGIILFSFKPEQSQEVTIKVTAQEAEYMIQVLAKRPYEESAGLINKIASQVRPQLEQKK